MNLSELTDEVLAYLRSFSRDQSITTFITSDIAVDTLQIPIADPNYVSRGRVQLDDEIIWVDSVDRATKMATIPPYGRGMDGTTAKEHKVGSQLDTNPSYPNHVVKKTINQLINSLGYDLFAVRSFQVRAKTLGYNYEVPADAKDILSVSYIAMPSSWKFPTYVRNWTFDPQADPSVSSTGKCVYIYDVVTPLFQYTVTYAGYPTELKSDEAEFTDSGLPASAWDVVVLGAASRLISLAGVAMLQSQAVEANVIDQRIDPMQATGQSKYLYGLYTQRLSEERMRLLNTYANRSRYQR